MYYATPWRQAPEYQGGFVLDGGVHYAALLRTVFASNVTVKAAVSKQFQKHLPPCDTVQALLSLEDGTIGTFLTSFGIESKPDPAPPLLAVYGSLGSMVISLGDKLTLRFTPIASEATAEELSLPKSDGVYQEMTKFVQLAAGKVNSSALAGSEPIAALKDLQLTEDILSLAK